MRNPEIRIAIADDHPMVRIGLRSFLELSDDIVMVGEAENGEEAVRLALNEDVDVMLMDLVMPGNMDGIAAIAAICAEKPTAKVIALTSFQDPQRTLDAITAGAIGFLQKDVTPDDLLSAIRQAAAGRTVLEFQALDLLRDGAKTMDAGVKTRQHTPEPDRTATDQSLASPLTQREQEVLEALASGQSNKEIAASLGITEKTVKVHISHILAKLNVYDRTQALIAAARHGLISL